MLILVHISGTASLLYGYVLLVVYLIFVARVKTASRKQQNHARPLFMLR
jgi:hypothetical protein